MSLLEHLSNFKPIASNIKDAVIGVSNGTVVAFAFAAGTNELLLLCRATSLLLRCATDAMRVETTQDMRSARSASDRAIYIQIQFSSSYVLLRMPCNFGIGTLGI